MQLRGQRPLRASGSFQTASSVLVVSVKNIIMDALAGYGSDPASDSDNGINSSGSGALSGLLTHYSDESDDNFNKSGDFRDDVERKKSEIKSSMHGRPGEKEMCSETFPRKRRRWDNANEDRNTAISIGSVIPPPSLSSNSNILYHKDYTTNLRRTLTAQAQAQDRNGLTKENQQLNKTLKQLRNKLRQQNRSATDSTPYSFLLKAQRDFGNPHLIKSVITHYSLSPLQSHVGNTFGSFEGVERLVAAEEKARSATSKHTSGMRDCPDVRSGV